MSKIIPQLWNGELAPVNNLGADTPELRQLECLMSRHLERLENSLNKETKEVLNKFLDCTNDYNFEIREQAFCMGFSLGAKITAEALVTAER
ncbi:MAG: hypothetical protein IKD04_02520 [Clostridia bacterium]|nr:hypothetical protein [Clostridia bacterium]